MYRVFRSVMEAFERISTGSGHRPYKKRTRGTAARFNSCSAGRTDPGRLCRPETACGVTFMFTIAYSLSFSNVLTSFIHFYAGYSPPLQAAGGARFQITGKVSLICYKESAYPAPPFRCETRTQPPGRLIAVIFPCSAGRAGPRTENRPGRTRRTVITSRIREGRQLCLRLCQGRAICIRILLHTLCRRADHPAGVSFP